VNNLVAVARVVVVGSEARARSLRFDLKYFEGVS
jgi:hypothetical protein